MKKVLKYGISLLMMMTLVGCSNDKKAEVTAYNVLCPTGAPSLGFVSEYEEITKNGKMDLVEGSDQLVAELSKKDSQYDIIVAPINLGAKLIAGKQTDYKIAGVLTWGNLYYVGTSEDALQGQGEIALFGQGAVPEKIVNTVAIETTLAPTYYHSASLVQQQLLAGKVEVGLLAEPLASATIAKAKQSGLSLSIIKDLQKEYGEQGYPQAAIFVKGDSDYQELFNKIDAFTNNGYDGLQEDLEKIGIEKLQLPSVDITVKSIDRQNVHYKKASDVKKEIEAFLKVFNITYSDDMLA